MELSDNPLMQYTGLKDKNGVEIYEGDILKEHPRYPGDSDKYWEVTYAKDKAYFGMDSLDELHRGDICGIWQFYSNCLEVIGNIYENPELLEE